MSDQGADEASAREDEAALGGDDTAERTQSTGGALEPREAQDADDSPTLLRQRLAVRALVLRRNAVLLARLSPLVLSAVGAWTLPGGGVDHGEHPDEALHREVFEETGLQIRDAHIFAVYSRHFVGTSPAGVREDFHGVHLIYRAEAAEPDVEPTVTEVDGTTDAVAWVPLSDIADGSVVVVEVVLFALRESGLASGL